MLLQMAVFHFYGNIPLYVWKIYPFIHFIFNHLLVDRHVVCFHVLTLTSSAVVNIRVVQLVSFWIRISIFSGYMPRSGITESHSVFSFVRNPHTVFHSGYINLSSYQHVEGFPFLYTLSSIYYL